MSAIPNFDRNLPQHHYYETGYLQLLNHLLEIGATATPRSSPDIYLTQRGLTFDLRRGLSVMSTAPSPSSNHLSAVATELSWFLSGTSSILPLVEAGISHWSRGPYNRYLSDYEADVSLSEFESRLLTSESIAEDYSDLGDAYTLVRDFTSTSPLDTLPSFSSLSGLSGNGSSPQPEDASSNGSPSRPASESHPSGAVTSLRDESLSTNGTCDASPPPLPLVQALNVVPRSRHSLLLSWSPSITQEISDSYTSMRHQPLSLSSGFHLHSDGRHLDLIWHHRRVKIISEYPSTLLLYDLLLRLIAHRVGLTPRYVTCHAECWVLSEVGRGVQQMSRNTSPPPTVDIDHQDQFCDYRAEDFSISESKRSALSSL